MTVMRIKGTCVRADPFHGIPGDDPLSGGRVSADFVDREAETTTTLVMTAARAGELGVAMGSELDAELDCAVLGRPAVRAFLVKEAAPL